MTNEGDGLAMIRRNMYDDDAEEGEYTVLVVPKTVTGDVVDVLIRRHHMFYAEAELVKVSRVSRRSSKRNDKLVVCPHFSKCSGCQLQMLSYEDQLEFKKCNIKRLIDTSTRRSTRKCLLEASG